MTKRAKVIMGWYCVRCGHKIPEAQCSTLRVLYSGTCSKCANEYYGAIGFDLSAGSKQAHIEYRQYRNEDMVYPVITGEA